MAKNTLKIMSDETRIFNILLHGIKIHIYYLTKSYVN
jgi:hypothetical protein